MIELMYKIMTSKDGEHEMVYGYLLSRVFDHFNVPLGIGWLE